MLDAPAVWAGMPSRLPADRYARPHLSPDSDRAVVLRDALTAAGATLVPARSYGDAPLRAVHDPRLLTWLAEGPAPDPAGRAAARLAADAALTAADVVASGGSLAVAICPVPGLHAGRASYDGPCYLNNAGVAAQALRSAGVPVVAVIDMDAHHGDGTQSLFYDRADVYYGSAHIRPDSGGSARHTGAATERGAGPGLGRTRNVPLAPGTGDPGWLAALAWLAAEAAEYRARAVVLSLGLDASVEDPGGLFRLSADGFRIAGTLIRDLDVPVVVVPEDGDHLPTIGPLTVAVLRGIRGALR